MNNNSTSSLKLKTPFLQPSKDKILLQEKTVRDRIVGLNMQNRHISKISFKFVLKQNVPRMTMGLT